MLATLIIDRRVHHRRHGRLLDQQGSYDDLQRTDLSAEPVRRRHEPRAGRRQRRHDRVLRPARRRRAGAARSQRPGHRRLHAVPARAGRRRSNTRSSCRSRPSCSPASTRAGSAAVRRPAHGRRRPGRPRHAWRENDVLLSKRAAGELDARLGDTITIYRQRQRRTTSTVAGIVEERARQRRARTPADSRTPRRHRDALSTRADAHRPRRPGEPHQRRAQGRRAGAASRGRTPPPRACNRTSAAPAGRAPWALEP